MLEQFFVTPKTAKEILMRHNSVLIDVREPFEISLMTIRGLNVLHIPLGQLANNMDKLDNYSTIVLICRTDKRSSMAAQLILDNTKRKEVYIIKGGIVQWWADYPDDISESESASEWYAV